MCKNKEKRHIFIDGQAVPVTEEIYRTYWYYERKEKYFSHDLKTKRFQRDTATFLPSREDSLDRLLTANKQFSINDKPLEEKVVTSIWMEQILKALTKEEQEIIYQIYYLEQTERQACAALNMARTTFQRKRDKLLEKLRELVRENSIN